MKTITVPKVPGSFPDGSGGGGTHSEAVVMSESTLSA